MDPRRPQAVPVWSVWSPRVVDLVGRTREVWPAKPRSSLVKYGRRFGRSGQARAHTGEVWTSKVGHRPEARTTHRLGWMMRGSRTRGSGRFTMLRRKFGCYVSLSTTVTCISTCNMNRLSLSHFLSQSEPPTHIRARAMRCRETEPLRATAEGLYPLGGHGSEGSGDGGGRATCPRPPTYPAIGYLRFASGHDARGGSSGINEATASGPSLRIARRIFNRARSSGESMPSG